MADWKTVRADGIAAAKRILDERSDTAELRAIVASWIAGIGLEGSQPSEDLTSDPSTVDLAEDLERRNLPKLAEALRLLHQREGKIPQGHWLLAKLVGLAAADNFAQALIEDEFRPPVLLSMDNEGSSDAFMSALSERLKSDQTAQDGFWRAVERLVKQLHSKPEASGLSAHQETITRAVQSYQAKPDVEEAWESHLDSHVFFGDGYLFDIARRVSPARYLEYLGQLPHPVFVEQWVAENHGRNLPDLVRAAPLAFDQAGTFQPQGMVILCLLKACSAECRRIAWGEEAAAHGRQVIDIDSASSELRIFVDALIGGLSKRQDGTLVAWCWLEHLILEGERGGSWRYNGQDREEAVLDPLVTLIGQLSSMLRSRPDYIAWINEVQPLRRINRIAAVLAVAGQQQSPGADLTPTLTDVLIPVAPSYPLAGSALSSPDCVVGRIGGGYLLSANNPVHHLEALWDEIRPLREHAWRFQDGDTRNDVGTILALWAIFAMEAASGELKGKLWLSLRKVLEDAMQTDHASSPDRFWPDALRRFCLSAKDVLPDEPADRLEFLSELLRPYVRANGTFFDLVFALEGSGVDRSSIEAAVARWSFTLKVLAAQYLAAENLRIERKILSFPWLDRVRSLVGERIIEGD
ncbi:hypothetical protein NKH34_30650 [Mesorhizobium sp. M1148]|uniref:hypothetical protein n=1 Tax=unclassified Mesorhizobium TaxID=325217 RepID=UPI0033377EFD